MPDEVGGGSTRGYTKSLGGMTSGEKWLLAGATGVLAALLFSPPVARMSAKVGQLLGDRTGRPSGWQLVGWILQCIVFIILLRFFLG